MSAAKAFLEWFLPNPDKHGKHLRTDGTGNKLAKTVEGQPVTPELVQVHLLGSGGFTALGYLPGGETGTRSGIIDLDLSKYPDPGGLHDAWLRLLDVAELWGWNLYPETSTRGGMHVHVFTDRSLTHKVMRKALKALALAAALPHFETYPAGDSHLSTWSIMPYAGAANDPKRLGNTFLCTADAEPIPYDELSEWLEPTPSGLLAEKAAELDESSPVETTTEPADLAPEALEALKRVASAPPATFERHGSLVAFINLGGRCGRAQEMLEHLKSEQVRTAWVKDGSRDARTWTAEVDRWLKAKPTNHKRGLSYLRAQGFNVPDLPKSETEKATTGSGSKGTKRTPTLVRMDTVEREDVSYLWPPYIPLGKPTNLEGDPGLGKSFIALTVSAIVTKGYPFPSADLEGFTMKASDLPPSNVIYMTGEDGLADTLKPRLEAAGADCSRVFVLQTYKSEHKNGDEKEHPFSLQDVDVLEQALQETGAKLIVIDPIQGYLGRGVDMNQANDVRPVLSAVGQLADKYRCAIISIRHLAKSVRSPLHKGLGSVDFTAFARSQLLVGKHNGQTVMTHAKSSLAPAGKSLAYELRDGRLYWLGASDSTPEDVANPLPPTARNSDDEEADKLEQARTVLKLALDEAPTPSKQLYSEASQLGISKRTLERAKSELQVKATPLRLPNDPTKNVWFWHYDCQMISVNEAGEIEATPLQKTDGGHDDHGESYVPDAKTQHRQEEPMAGMDGGVENDVQDGVRPISANTATFSEGGVIPEDDPADWEALVGATEGEL